jgi:GNAT superfamily N-acetyltransferase
MHIKTRAAGPEDAALIAPLFDAYRQFYHRPSDPDGALIYIRTRLVRQEAVVFIARNEKGTALGFVQMYPSFDSLAMRPAWILYDLFVSPDCRRQGVARDLMKRAEEHARHRRFLCRARDRAG